MLNYLDEPPCDISRDWCGWRSLGGWKRITYQELQQQASQQSHNEDVENDADNTDQRSKLCCFAFLTRT